MKAVTVPTPTPPLLPPPPPVTPATGTDLVTWRRRIAAHHVVRGQLDGTTALVAPFVAALDRQADELAEEQATAVRTRALLSWITGVCADASGSPASLDPAEAIEQIRAALDRYASQPPDPAPAARSNDE